MARGHLRLEKSVPDLCIRLFASGNIHPWHLHPGHLRPTICVRKHPSRTFESRHLRITVIRFWWKISSKADANVRNGNVRDGSFRTQMFGHNCTDANVRDGSFRMQMSGRKCQDSNIRTEKSGTQISGRKWPLAVWLSVELIKVLSQAPLKAGSKHASSQKILPSSNIFGWPELLRVLST